MGSVIFRFGLRSPAEGKVDICDWFFSGLTKIGASPARAGILALYSSSFARWKFTIRVGTVIGRL